jgi:hypothetical protein
VGIKLFVSVIKGNGIVIRSNRSIHLFDWNKNVIFGVL